MTFEEERQPIVLMNEGKKIFGVIHRPKSNARTAAVLICPGFAGNKCGKFRMFVSIAEELAKRGITVLRFDYRGSGDSEGEFADITLEGKISDTLCALNYLSSDQRIDSERIGILGRSLGGAVAVLAARRCGTIKSLALLAPVFTSEPWKLAWEKIKSHKEIQTADLEKYAHLPATMPNKHFLAEFFHMDLHREMEGLKSIPLLHIHGMKDQIVGIEQAKEFEATRGIKDNSRFIQLPSSDHDFSDNKERLMVINEVIQWYQNTLLG